MARFDIIGLQYFTDGGELLGGGKLNFYETGSTTRKDTFSDAAMTIANTNPVTLDADGRAPNIFFAGLAKCVLTDSTGAILETRDPVGDDSASKNGFPDWAADVTYSFNQPVSASDGYIYTSLVNNNIGNDPISSPAEWQLIAQTIGFPDTPNGAVLVVDTSEDLKFAAVPKNTIRALVPITTTTASNSATVDFTNINSDFTEYLVVISKAKPVSASDFFFMRTSSNNGVSYDSAGSDYRYGGTLVNTASGLSVVYITGDSVLKLAGIGLTIGNDAGSSGVTAVIRIISPSTAAYTEITCDSSWNIVTAPNPYGLAQLAAARLGSSATNAIRFAFNTGNISSGTFTLYGVRTS